MKKISVFFGLVYFLLCIVSCGLETYIYLYPVEIITSTEVTRGEVFLPTQYPPSDEYFRNYTIYYRIYLTDFYEPTFVDGSQRRNVNTFLDDHFNTLSRYTVSESLMTTAITKAFSDLNYHILSAADPVTQEEIPLYRILNSPSPGTVPVRFDFTAFHIPYFTEPSGNSYLLFRSRSSEPAPNRLFNYSESLATSPITSNSNADVQPKTGSGSTRYAYVSMYILASGIDNGYSQIFSRPSHIGIFLLPWQNP